jgi:hypothetical protein
MRKLDHIITAVLWNAVPNRSWPWRVIRQGIKPTLEVAVLPSVKCGARNAQHIKRLLGGQMLPFDRADDFQLL